MEGKRSAKPRPMVHPVREMFGVVPQELFSNNARLSLPQDKHHMDVSKMLIKMRTKLFFTSMQTNQWDIK